MSDEGGDFDNWEDQADSGVFDKRLDEMSVEIQSSTEKKLTSRGQVLVDSSGSTPYQPKVRILKRDAKSSQQADGNKALASGSKPNKTLQQREAEYAEARMRIFGCLSPEEEEETGGADSATNTNGDRGDTDKNNSSNLHLQGVPQIYKSAAGGGTGVPCAAPVPVLRQPRGPDGTSGFNKPDHT